VDSRIRALSLDDVPSVAAIYREASTARAPDEISDAVAREMVQQALDTGVALAAVEGARVVGFVLAPRHPVRRLSHVITNVLVCLEPEVRGRGLGRQLMTAMMRLAAETGWCERIEFHVRSSNVRAVTLYESLGFAIEGRLRARVATDDGGRQDDLIMGWLVPRS
jgi:ribosomal protein S18 acetylase RimI-like enzyme